MTITGPRARICLAAVLFRECGFFCWWALAFLVRRGKIWSLGHSETTL